jgi:hypothetical protein
MSNIFKQGLEHDKRLKIAERRKGRNMARANHVLTREAEIRAAETGETFTEAIAVVRTRHPAVARCSETGNDLPTSGPDKAVIEKYHGSEPKTSRTYTKKDEEAALVRNTVDRAISKALAEGLISDYKFGPAYLESADPWLWKRYMSLSRR